MINLITSDWLPVRRASGLRETIAPHQLTDGLTGPEPIVSLDFGRPDLDGAVTELLIGLIAVAMGPKGDAAWAEVWRAPPSSEDLRTALAPLAFAFNLGGDGPRCFQDLDALESADPTPTLHLLIDYPGANALKLNTDHFTKRDARSLSAPDAAAALVALQTWAPSGGAGHRTGVRGGGPLTTLAHWPRELPRREDKASRAINALWDKIWLNVPEVRDPPALNDKLFPWLAPTHTSSGKEVVTPEPTIAHPLQVFFGMPRRIRMDFNASGDVTAYRSLAYGMNYPAEAWRHPLSPYYKDAKGNVLPVHPRAGPASYRAGPASYRDWLGVLVNSDRAFRATCIETVANRLTRIGVRRNDRRADILAFGYDQDKAKTRGFVVQSVPWIVAAREKTFSDAMAVTVEAAEAAAKAVRYAVQMAHHGEVSISDKGDASISLRDAGKKAAEDVYHAFFALSEPDFRAYLGAVAPLELFEDGHEARTAFAQACRRVARQLFAAHVDMDGRDMRRPVLAEKWLGVALTAARAKSYVFKSLQLEIQEAAHG